MGKTRKSISIRGETYWAFKAEVARRNGEKASMSKVVENLVNAELNRLGAPNWEPPEEAHIATLPRAYALR